MVREVSSDWRRLPSSLSSRRLDEDALASWGRRATGTLRQALTEGTFADVSPPPWTNACGHIEGYFGFGNRNHCLTAQPHDWTDFHEAQITRGLAHWLDEGPRVRVRARIVALWQALSGRPAPFFVGDIVTVAIHAEADAGAMQRIDLLIELTLRDGRPFAIAIEAKFAHRLASRQLAAYELAVRRRQRYLPEQLLLVVVAQALRRDISDAMARHPDWHFVSWNQLLLRFESLLVVAPTCDNDDFRRFRRTIWSRANA